MSARHNSYSARLFTVRNVLVCGQCGTQRECSLPSLLRHAQQGWPRCCGEVMILTALDSANAQREPDSDQRAPRAG